MAYEAAGEANSWAEAVARSNMGARAKYVCLMAALDFSPSGRVDLGAKDDWVSWLSARSGLPPKDIEKTLESIRASGYLVVIRTHGADGEYSVHALRQSRPLPDGAITGQVFMARSAAMFEANVRQAMRTDTKERNLEPTLQWG